MAGHRTKPSGPALRVKALEALLEEKGLVNSQALDTIVETYETRVGPRNGARVVAKAWTDPAFKNALLKTGREALREFGIHQGKAAKLVVVENTESIHNVVVCTLCSCYPYDILGDTPWWYKHDIYKTRIVQNPRVVVKEMFGLEIPDSQEVQVHDSTSDVRYFVLPQRPKGTEGMSEADLAKLVTVDSLIGAGLAMEPAQLRAAAQSGVAPEMPRVRPD